MSDDEESKVHRYPAEIARNDFPSVTKPFPMPPVKPPKGEGEAAPAPVGGSTRSGETSGTQD